MHMKKIKILVCSIIILLCSSFSVCMECFAADEKSDGFKSYTTKASFGDYTYDRYFVFSSQNDASNLVVLEDGTYMRVHEKFIDKKIIVEYYDKKFKLTGTRNIKYQLDRYCGFYSDGKYNYMIFAQNNPNKDNNKVVCLVVKYSKNWKILGKCAIKNTNVTKYMNYTGTSMLADSGKLYIRSAREMYNGHQANITYIIRISDMKLLEKYDQIEHNKYGYVSHSFAQFLAKDGHNIITADHGDAFPRGVVIQDSALEKKKLVFKCVGKTGENNTGLCLGGLGVSGQSYITVGSSMDQNISNIKDEEFTDHCIRSVKNVFVSVWDKNTDKARTTFLTDYKSCDELHDPYIVEINRNRFVVMWEHNNRVYYVEIDGAGKRVTPIKNVKAHMNVKPVINDGKIVWLSYDKYANITFYTLPVSSLKCKLSTPGGVKFSVESNSIKIKWNSVAGADGYFVYRKQSGASYKKIAVVQDGSKPLYYDKNVKDGQVYTYTIKAYRKQGKTVKSGIKKSGWSQRYLATVTVKSVFNTSNGINITWANMKAEQGYYLYKKENDGKFTKIATLKANKTSYEDKNVSRDNMYTYYVIQYRGKSLKSKGNIQKKSAYYVEKPGISKVSVGEDSIKLELFGESDRYTYIYRSVDNGKYKKIATFKQNEIVYYDRDVSEGKLYRYRIIERYKGSNSIPSDTVTKTYLKKVNINNIVNGKKNVELSWTTNKNATKYYVYRKDASYLPYKRIAIVNGSQNTSYVDIEVGNKNTVTYTVRAVDSYSISSASPEQTIEHLDEPVINKVSVGAGKIDVSITIPNNCGVDLYRKTDNDDFVKIKHFTNNYTYSYEDSDVVSGKTYTYAAQAVDGEYKSSMSESMSATYVCAISGLRAIQNENIVTLSWDKVEGALNYKIYNVCKNDEFIVQTEDTQADIVLEANKDYTFGVMVEGKDYISNIIASKDVFYYIENPEILSVVQEDNKVYISTNISPFYENVSLYRKSSGDYSKVDAGKDSEGVFKDTIPGDGLCYSYKIVATDIYGNKKEVVSDTQVSYVGTVTINSVMYDTDSNTIRVSFDKAEEGAAGYIVYKSTNGSDFTPIKKIDNIEMTTFVDMDFDSNNTYSYKVAVYGGYEGALSNEVKIFIPKSPDGLNVESVDDNYYISWNSVQNCDEYILYIIYPDNIVSRVNVSDTSYVISAHHGISQFYVNSYVDGVESKWTGNYIRAGYVINSERIYFSYIEDGFKIQYDEIQNVDGYALFKHDGEEEKFVAYIEDSAVLEYDDTELDSGTTYEYRLCGFIDDGDKRYLSSGIKLRKIKFMERPKIVQLTAGNGQVNITWSQVGGAVRYTLCRREKGKNWSPYAGGITDNSYTDTGVTVGTQYEYAVIAFSAEPTFSSYFDWDKSEGDKITAE